MHSWTWNEICRPRSKGHLGIRRLKDLCSTAGLELFGRMCTSNSLWVDWMRGIYLKNQHIWDVDSHLVHSYTWKLIINMKHESLLHIRKLIGNGKDASLWCDPWLTDGK